MPPSGLFFSFWVYFNVQSLCGVTRFIVVVRVIPPLLHPTLNEQGDLSTEICAYLPTMKSTIDKDMPTTGALFSGLSILIGIRGIQQSVDI